MHALQSQTLLRSAAFVATLTGIAVWYAGPSLLRSWAESRVQIRIQYDAQGCPTGQPLRVTIHNRGTRKVRVIGWRLVGRPEALDAEPLVARTYTTLPLIRPGFLDRDDRHTVCLELPFPPGHADPASLTFTPEHKHVWFVE